MLNNKGKKARKQRGSRTHGWGSPKKHRGAGNRGGRGQAGSGKKGQQKMSLLWSTTGKKIGRNNLARPTQVIVKDETINLREIEERLDSLVASKAATKKGETFELDLSVLGKTKLLATGSISSKLSIKTFKASERAVAKVKAAGGSVEVLSAEAAVEAAPAPKE